MRVRCLTKDMREATTTVDATVDELVAVNQRLQVELRLATEQVAYLTQQLYGVKRERLPDHPELFELPPEAPAPRPVVQKVEGHTRKRRHPGRHAFPDHLPREVIDIPLSDEEKVCGHCQSDLVELAPEITEELERVRARLFVRQYRREKCGCRSCGGEMRTAPAPNRPI